MMEIEQFNGSSRRDARQADAHNVIALRGAVALFLLALALVTTACGDDDDAAAPTPSGGATSMAPDQSMAPTESTAPTEKSGPGVAFGELDSGLHNDLQPEKLTVLGVRTEKQFDGFVKRTGLEKFDAPDFSLKQLVAVLLKPGGGGESVRVTQIRQEGSGTVVRAVHTRPGNNCVTTAVLTNPYTVVSSQRTTGPFRVELGHAERDCD
ncbi:MAG: hypothetical protein WAP35_04985 [Solirubrobacterales bacterium]